MLSGSLENLRIIKKTLQESGSREESSDSVIVHTGYIGTGAILVPGFGTQT